MAGTEAKDAITPEKQDKIDHAKDTATKEIQAMPASTQREAVTKEWQRVASSCGSSLPELTIASDKGKQVAVITQDGKPLEVIDESGKSWKSDGKNLFSDGQNQSLLAPKTIDGQPAKNADGTPQYDLMPVQTREVDNGDGTKHSVVTQITDGDGRKWVSADGQQFIGAAGSDGAGQAGDQRILKNNNGSLEFSDPKGGSLSEQAIKGKEQEIQDLIQKSTPLALPTGDISGFAPAQPQMMDASNLNKVLENTSPELLARYDNDLNLRKTLKGKMYSKDYEDMTRILDGSKSIITAHADRIFANGTGNTEVDSTQAEQETRRLLLQTNSGDMPKLNDDLLKRINADPTEKNQYDQYIEQHKNDPGFDTKNAALLSFSQHWSKETQDAMPLLVKGNDKLDTADGGTTPRAQLVKQALDGKDFDLFKTAVTGASPEARAAIPSTDVDKAFYDKRWLSSGPTAESERNLAMAHDLLAKGDVQPTTLIKYSNADQADKILAKLTPEQRNSYIQGKDNTDPNNPDHQFYTSMQDAFKQASSGDDVRLIKMDDEARKQDGSFVSTLAKHEGSWYGYNDSSYQINQDFGSLTDEQRKDLSENFTVRRQQVEDMMKALNRDPQDVLNKFDQFFKKQPNAQPDSDGAAMSLLDKVHTEQGKVVAAEEGDTYGTNAFARQAENVALVLHHGFQDDPGLFARLKNPQTDSEKQLADMLKDQDKLFGASAKNYGMVATEGRLPLDVTLAEDRGDLKLTTKDILGASPEEQKHFLSDPDYGKLLLGSSGFNSNADEKYDIMKNAIAQGKLQPEDSARAVAIGWTQPEDLKSLTGLSSEMGANYQKKYGEDLQLTLLNKFGHQNEPVNGFLSQYNNVFQKSDTLNHDTAVAGSGWASKILDGSGSMSPQQMDLAATQMADLSAKLQKQLDASPDGAAPAIKSFLDSQKRLKDAIDNHEDATKQLTETVDKAVNLAVTAAILTATAGGASVPMIMAGIAAGGASRYALKDGLEGANWKDKDKANDTFNLAVDTIAQLSATRLLKVAEVFKGMKAGEAITEAKSAELEALGIDRQTVARLNELEKPAVTELPTSSVSELPAPPPAVSELPADAPRELPAPNAAPNPAPNPVATPGPAAVENAALPKPMGQEIAAAEPAPPASQELAKLGETVVPANLPVEAPLQLPAPSAGDIISGNANPAALANLSPKTQEFLFQMAQLSGIGAIDAKLKGQSAVEGALEWAAMGAAAHGVFAGLERAGIKAGFPEGSLKGEVTADGLRPEVNDSPTLTTGDGRTITRNGDGWSVDGQAKDVRFSKDGDKYIVEINEHDNVWTRYDSENQHGTQFTKPAEGTTTSVADAAKPVDATTVVADAAKPVDATTVVADAAKPVEGQDLAPTKDPLNLPRTTIDPSPLDSTDENLPTVRQTSDPAAKDPAAKEPVPAVRAATDTDSSVPATRETVPAVRAGTDPVPDEAAAAAEREQRSTTTAAEKAAIATGQAAQLLPADGQTTTADKVAPPPADAAPEVPPPSAVPAPVERPPLEPSQTLAALATVKNWEGPFHSADRVLQAVLGRHPTFEELRTLTRAMQEQYKLDHNGQEIKNLGLKHGEQFITAQNTESLLGQVAKNNPELAAQMKSYMQVDQDLGAKLGRPAAIDEVRAVASQLQHDFAAENQLQNFMQPDAQKWQAYEANANLPKTLQDLEANNSRLQPIAQIYQTTGKLPPDGIISQRAFPSSAGQLHHKRAARR
jgi:hypothetical protein